MFDLVSARTDVAAFVPLDINISPKDDELAGISLLRNIVGAVTTVGLILSALALFVSAINWASAPTHRIRTSLTRPNTLIYAKMTHSRPRSPSAVGAAPIDARSVDLGGRVVCSDE